MSGIAWWEVAILASIVAFFLTIIILGILTIRSWNRVLKERERMIEARKRFHS